MPNLVGMSLEQARAEMRRVGFREEHRVRLQWVDEPGCKPLTVCRTYPEAMNRSGAHSDKIIFAARDPNAAPPPEAPATPAPDGTRPTPTPTPTPRPTPEPSGPEPFF
jgi:hypothetical protein